MQLSITSWEMAGVFGEEKAYALLKEAGFDGVDFTFNQNHARIRDNHLENAHNTKCLLDKYELSCVQAHAPFDFPFEALEDNYLYIVRAIEYAGILGAPYIVVHYVVPTEGIAFLEYNRSFFKSLEPHAKKAGVVIAIENLFHWDKKRAGVADVYFANPYALKDFVHSLNSDVFVVCVDIGHASLTHTEPEDYIRVFDNRMLRVLHVQDTDYLDDRHTLPGLGTLNWDRITKALGEIDYQGSFSYEIGNYINGFVAEHRLDAASLAAKVGRRLIAKVEAARIQRKNQ